MIDHGSLCLVHGSIAGLLFSLYSFVQFSSIIYMLCMWQDIFVFFWGVVFQIGKNG